MGTCTCERHKLRLKQMDDSHRLHVFALSRNALPGGRDLRALCSSGCLALGCWFKTLAWHTGVRANRWGKHKHTWKSLLLSVIICNSVTLLSLAADLIHQTKTANHPKCSDSPVRKEKHQTADITVRHWERMSDTSRTFRGWRLTCFWQQGRIYSEQREWTPDRKKKLNWPAEPLSRGGSTFVWWQLCSKPRGWSWV